MLFLVLFLFYCAYFMLRFSLEPGRARANMSAVYALFGVVLIPVSFLAIRLSQKFIHPVVFNSHGPQMTGSQFFTFCVSLAAMLALFATLYQRRARRQARRRQPARAAGAARHEHAVREWHYVAAAYLVVFVAVLVWVAIIAREARSGSSGSSASSSTRRGPGSAMVEALFWPALLGVRRGGVRLRRRARHVARLATWGVRLGWLAQTALLAVQAAHADAFPWSSWAGSLNLFVWLVVGAYLIWGCRPRYRLLGLVRDATRGRCCFVVARIGGGTERRRRQPTTATSSSSCTSGSCSPRSRASRSPPGWPGSTSGRSGG